MKEMTLDQVRQVRRMLKALQKAVENLKSISRQNMLDKNMSDKEKEKAIATLSQAHFVLESNTRNLDDLRMRVFLIHLNKKRYEEVKVALNRNSLMKSLHLFGCTPWVLIQEVFTGADIICPLELSAFHTAYQEELKGSS